MDSENRKKAKQPIWLYAILGALAIALVVLLVRNSSMKTDLQELEAEKEMQRADFQAEVDSLMRVHNELKESYGELSQELAEKDSIIQADAVEIKKLLDSQWDYYRIKKKLASLQAISQKYVRQMDSLYTVNQELVAENERIREEFQAERRENTNLNRQKEELTNKVNQAAVLKLYNYSAQAVRFKGGSKESTTDRADRAERIRMDFTVAANDLIQPGSKTFYVRIADPTRAIISKGTGDEYAFESNGETLQFTEKIRVNYEGKETPVRAYYTKPADREFRPGTYFIDVYEQGGKLIGQTSVDLK
jgi:DNA polymerase III alpha subunit (gram-positive type)